jgi:hypothetical protein
VLSRESARKQRSKLFFRRVARASRRLIDHLPGADGGGNPGEIADICDGIAVEDHEIGIKALLYPALLRGLEIARGAVWVIGVLIARAPICISDRFDRNISLAASALSITSTSETTQRRSCREEFDCSRAPSYPWEQLGGFCRAKEEFNGVDVVVSYLTNKGDNHENHDNSTSNCVDPPEYVRPCARWDEHGKSRQSPLQHGRCGRSYCNQTQECFWEYASSHRA